MGTEIDGSILSSADIKQLMLNMEKEQDILDSARKPLLIMITDLVNSTMYYDRLGDVAAKSIIFKHNNLLFPIIEANSGTVIKTTGDGILAVFEDANAGVLAASTIQDQLKSYNIGRDLENTITVRIGLHYGKTIVFENDVYGDSINTTARIESIAEGNEIILSDSVVAAAQFEAEQLVNLGCVQLKGKLEPINLFGFIWNPDDPLLPISYEAKQRKYCLNTNEAKESACITINGLIENDEAEKELKKENCNPFLNRSAIMQSEYFYGREVLIHKIYSRISASRPQSVSLYGERRIGKSSLLNIIRSMKLRKQYLNDINRFIFIHIDVQSMRSASVSHFIEVLFEGVRNCFGGKISFVLKPTYQDFTKLVAEINKAEISIIIMFDEFDLITLNPNFDVEFYSWLRSLASHYNLAFITSSLSQLHQLCATKKISDSPFFNIFTAWSVGQFTREEVLGMVRSMLSLSLLEYSFENWMEEIISQAGYFPFFIQIYCSNLFEMFSANPSPKEVYEAFRDEANDHFAHIYRNLSEAEIACLHLLLNKKQLSGKHDNELLLLNRKGYVINENGSVRIFSQAFAEFLRMQSEQKTSKSLWSKLWNK